MEVHRQTCQQCGAREQSNLILREPGKSHVVIAVCARCEQLVARYELKSYYHHGKGFEAWLRHVAVSTESSLDLQDAFATLRDTALDELQRARAQVEASKDEQDE